MQAAVDVVGFVEEGVVDQAFPAYGGTRFFKIDAHDDGQLVFKSRHLFMEAGCIFDCSFRIMDGAGANDDEQSVILAFDNVICRLARFRDHLSDRRCRRIVLDEDCRGDKRFDIGDADVVCLEPVHVRNLLSVF